LDRRRVFSGVQPTGVPHLGNYLGAFRQWVALQDDHEAFYCVVDLHAMTVPWEPETLRRGTLEVSASLLACGVDPERSVLFVQSHVGAHAELAWILTCIARLGELRRMVQFKERSRGGSETVGAGLLTYPVLQAADVLAYRADEVPVGEDQKQHVELMRDIAQRFNARFGETFVLPEHRIPEVGARIMDLQAPEKRMSTTASTEQGAVYILDEPDVVRKKFRSAVTDSGRDIVRAPEKPGISNLIEIMAVARGITPEAVEKEYERASGYADFKSDVGDAVADVLAPIRQRYEEIRPDPARLEEILAVGAGKARAISSGVVAEARERMGLGAPG
jgi:tryptophanyl-tRNA synthetase